MAKNVQELTKELLNDKDLVAKLENAESAQEVSELLAGKGVEISAEQIEAVMAKDQGELSEENLENVAGGAFKFRYLNPFYWLGRLLAAATTSGMC